MDQKGARFLRKSLITNSLAGLREFPTGIAGRWERGGAKGATSYSCNLFATVGKSQNQSPLVKVSGQFQPRDDSSSGFCLLVDPGQELVPGYQDACSDFHMGEPFCTNQLVGCGPGDSQDFTYFRRGQGQRKILVAFVLAFSQMITPFCHSFWGRFSPCFLAVFCPVPGYPCWGGVPPHPKRKADTAVPGGLTVPHYTTRTKSAKKSTTNFKFLKNQRFAQTE